MDFTSVEAIARAVLYEGYMLYPYRTSSLKNSRQCMFGSLYPKAHCLATGDTQPWSMSTECMIVGDAQTSLHVIVRFLQPTRNDECRAVEREMVLEGYRLAEISGGLQRVTFSFPGGDSLCAVVTLSGAWVLDTVFKASIHISNETPPDDPFANFEPNMLSTHFLLGVEGGRFHSLIDPPAEVRAMAEACRQRGLWPVLIGDPARSDRILAAPIILYDYPQIAPESPGNLFDGLEIDEILTLRIATLTEAEKEAMKADSQTRALLERTEQLSGARMRALHGAMRQGQGSIKPGDRVRLRPSRRADILDLALDGMSATVATIEEDFEGRVFYTVTLDDDPGQDLGIDGKPGHRFFFARDELEPLQEHRG